MDTPRAGTSTPLTPTPQAGRVPLCPRDGSLTPAGIPHPQFGPPLPATPILPVGTALAGTLVPTGGIQDPAVGIPAPAGTPVQVGITVGSQD